MTDLALKPVKVTLRNGSNLLLRLGHPADKEKVRSLFYRSSPQTRYLRFGCMKTHISDRELENLTTSHPPDSYVYVAIRGLGHQERIVALGCWYLCPDKRSAEVSFLVEDNEQLRGIGTALLEQLADAALAFGIDRFVAYVLPENTKMQEVFDNCGLKQKKHKAGDTYEIILELKRTEEYIKLMAARRHIASSTAIQRLLYPQGLAVFDPVQGSQAERILTNLLAYGFKGQVFPIGKKATHGELVGYPTLAQVPFPVEAALLTLPTGEPKRIFEQCAEKKVFGLIIVDRASHLPGETPSEWLSMLKEQALAEGMRILTVTDPGIINTEPQACLNVTFDPPLLRAGEVSILSSSRSCSLSILAYLRAHQLGVAHLVNLGEPLDVSVNDFLEFWADHEQSKIILLFLDPRLGEEINDPLLKRTAREKTIYTLPIAAEGGDPYLEKKVWRFMARCIGW